MKINVSLIAFLAAISASHGATLSALTSFSGDGVLTPADYGGGTTNLERHIAYNPTTGNLALTSRTTANRVDIINGASGAPVKTMTAPAGGYANAAINITTVAVSTDGQIFTTNLADGSGAASTLSVYAWPSESSVAAPSVGTFLLPTGLRLGDSLDAIGSGAGATILAGYQMTGAGGLGDDGMAVINQPLSILQTFDPTAGSAAGAFRLSASYMDSDTVFGNQNGTFRRAELNLTTGAVTSVTTITGIPNTFRHVDATVIDGVTYLAVLDSLSGTGRNTVKVFSLDATNTAATEVATGNLIGVGVGNANGTGDVEWGAITGASATLYTLTTNNGIQAFTFAVPEPSTMAFSGLAMLGLLRRRRK
jgi:hypothetical protein